MSWYDLSVSESICQWVNTSVSQYVSESICQWVDMSWVAVSHVLRAMPWYIPSVNESISLERQWVDMSLSVKESICLECQWVNISWASVSWYVFELRVSQCVWSVSESICLERRVSRYILSVSESCIVCCVLICFWASVSQYVSELICQWVNMSMSQYVSESICQWVYVSVSQYVSESICLERQWVMYCVLCLDMSRASVSRWVRECECACACET